MSNRFNKKRVIGQHAYTYRPSAPFLYQVASHVKKTAIPVIIIITQKHSGVKKCERTTFELLQFNRDKSRKKLLRIEYKVCVRLECFMFIINDVTILIIAALLDMIGNILQSMFHMYWQNTTPVIRRNNTYFTEKI